MIPKAKIKIKYTNGEELKYISTKKPYIGYYIETNNGEYYSGTDNIILGDLLELIGEDMNKNETPTITVKKYNLFKDKLKDFLEGTIPIPVMKTYPSEQDYKDGFVHRYFAKRINSSLYKEISQDVFDSINKKEKKYDYFLHEVGVLRWFLTGNVYQKNAQELRKREVNFSNISYLFPLLNEFFKPDTLPLQENLITNGGLLYTADGEEYIGLYHIHPTGGPMVGAYHTDIPHPKLYYINQLPSPGGISYEEWLQSQDTRTDVPAFPIREDDSILSHNESYTCTVVWLPTTDGYNGLTNASGQMPGGTQCIDPGDGTGVYTRREYGTSALSVCEENCSSINLNSTTNVGCLYAWDPNYCSDCNVHQGDMCGSGPYYPYELTQTCESGAPMVCGMYNGTVYYAPVCCNINGEEADSTYTGPGPTGGGGGFTGTRPYGGGGYNGPSCFISDTLITMADGTEKAISSIKIGEKVKSEIGESTVLDIQIHKGNFEVYSFNNRKAFVTIEHPFKTTEGWKAINPITTLEKHKVESKTLNLGDVIYKINKNETIETIEKGKTTHETVYNLMLDNEHVYYANGYLVHNEKQGGVSEDFIYGGNNQPPDDYIVGT